MEKRANARACCQVFTCHIMVAADSQTMRVRNTTCHCMLRQTCCPSNKSAGLCGKRCCPNGNDQCYKDADSSGVNACCPAGSEYHASHDFCCLAAMHGGCYVLISTSLVHWPHFTAAGTLYPASGSTLQVCCPQGYEGYTTTTGKYKCCLPSEWLLCVYLRPGMLRLTAASPYHLATRPCLQLTCLAVTK